jgi:spermidine/putrescine transport system substrate-binding protein
VTNYAMYADGIKGSPEFLDAELATSPEHTPRAGSGPGVFVSVCDQTTQEVYDQIWTRLRS